MTCKLPPILAAVLALTPLPAAAHGVVSPGSSIEDWLAALSAASIVLAGGAYAAGLLRLRASAGPARGTTPGRSILFMTGLIVLAVALLSPLDERAASSFSMHMVQHELLIIAVAPLIVAAEPGAVLLWAFPRRSRRAAGRGVFLRGAGSLWRAATQPVPAFCIFLVSLWSWHLPVLYEAGLRNAFVHVAQHASFLLGALVFWAAVIGRYGRGDRDGMAVLAAFATALHGSALGVLLTFSNAPWYPAYAVADPLLALQDQQLGGIVMWVVGGFGFLVGALVAAGRWLAAAEDRVAVSEERRRATMTAPPAEARP